MYYINYFKFIFLPIDPFENTEQPVISNSRTLTKVSPDEVAVPKGQPCNCPNCQESPTGKALRHKCHIENCGKEYAKTSHLRAHLGMILQKKSQISNNF